ncbi:hypothetical protein QBC44DRAFT_5152 [Cladorrhinum sp. PSN332]|nr:hypothetical protein QBC44DRAFT_5152 [Cladorrhinum sp. PSN332]
MRIQGCGLPRCSRLQSRRMEARCPVVAFSNLLAWMDVVLPNVSCCFFGRDGKTCLGSVHLLGDCYIGIELHTQAALKKIASGIAYQSLLNLCFSPVGDGKAEPCDDGRRVFNVTKSQQIREGSPRGDAPPPRARAARGEAEGERGARCWRSSEGTHWLLEVWLRKSPHKSADLWAIAERSRPKPQRSADGWKFYVVLFVNLISF